MINKFNKSRTFSSHSVTFERRNHRQQTVFPLVDSSGFEVLRELRISTSINLKRIKVEELLLQEKEFNELFNK